MTLHYSSLNNKAKKGVYSSNVTLRGQNSMEVVTDAATKHAREMADRMKPRKYLKQYNANLKRQDNHGDDDDSASASASEPWACPLTADMPVEQLLALKSASDSPLCAQAREQMLKILGISSRKDDERSRLVIMDRLEKLENFLLLIILILAAIAFKTFN